MTMLAEIAREAQKLATDRLVRLYELDATEIGGVVFRFTSSVDAKLALVSITHSGAVATVETAQSHAMLNGDLVRIANADQPEYNGDFTATVVDSTHFTYTMFSPPASDATGAYITAMRANNTVVFGGNTYIPVEIDVSGFEWDGQGSALPTPRLLISNKHRILAASVIALNNLSGATFTRIRTFRKHLDDGSTPDATMFFPKEVYRINRKVAQNKHLMEFELASPLDQEGTKIPGGQVFRDACMQRYRVFDPLTGTFDYTQATCPYVGDAAFLATGAPTTQDKDRCGKHLTDCILRFGGNPLPFRGAPGIGVR